MGSLHLGGGHSNQSPKKTAIHSTSVKGDAITLLLVISSSQDAWLGKCISNLQEIDTKKSKGFYRGNTELINASFS